MKKLTNALIYLVTSTIALPLIALVFIASLIWFVFIEVYKKVNE